MINIRNILLFSILCLLFSAGPLAQAQTVEERMNQLRAQIEALEKQSAQFRSSIAVEQAKKASLQKEITLLKNQISNLSVQVATTVKKIDKTNIEVSILETNIYDTQARISKQKSSIGRIMLFLSRQDNQPLLATMLKNDSLSQFFRQTQYAQELNSDLVNVIDELNKARELLEADKNELEDKKANLEQLKNEQEAKKQALNSAQYDKNDLLAKTKGQEKLYLKRLAELERQEAEFYTELRKLENAVVAGGLYIVHVTATKVPPKGTNIFQWPEDDYRFTQGYGMTAYARRGGYGGSPHNGVDLASGYGSVVKAIGAGEVVAFGKNKGFGNWIAIKHDDTGIVSMVSHLSAWAGLRVGSRVKAGDPIGYEGNTGRTTGPHVHLSLYKDFFTYEKNGELYFNYFEGTLNPLDYLP